MAKKMSGVMKPNQEGTALTLAQQKAIASGSKSGGGKSAPAGKAKKGSFMGGKKKRGY